MLNTKAMSAICAAALVALLASVPAGAAHDMQHTTYLSFSGAVALPGVTLPAGDYTFELALPAASLNTVLVTSRARHRVVFLGVTRPVERAAGGGTAPLVTLGEVRDGAPPPVRAWFPDGSVTGQEFIYR